MSTLKVDTIRNEADGTAVEINRTTSDGTILDLQKNGTTVGAVGTYNNDSYIGTDDTGVTFSNGSNALMPFNPSTVAVRDAGIDLGITTVRWKSLYLSGGVYLGGVGSANYLDDYEEGTWTPTIATGTVSASGWYRKIGSLVIVNIGLGSFSDRSTASAVVVNNLPFVAASTMMAGTGAVMGKYINLGDGAISCYKPQGNNNLYFYANFVGGDWVDVKHNNLNNTGAYLIAQIAYYID